MFNNVKNPRGDQIYVVSAVLESNKKCWLASNAIVALTNVLAAISFHSPTLYLDQRGGNNLLTNFVNTHRSCFGQNKINKSSLATELSLLLFLQLLSPRTKKNIFQ